MNWRRGQTATYWPKVLLTRAALLSRPGWAAQPWVTEDHKPSVRKLILTRGYCPQLTPTATGTDCNCLKPSVPPGYIIVLRTPASCGRTHQTRPHVKVIFRYLRPDAPISLFFWLFAQVHLLIDGSVEGQYVTVCIWCRTPFEGRNFRLSIYLR